MAENLTVAKVHNFLKDDKNILVSSNTFYEDQWRQGVLEILGYMNIPKPEKYDAFVAQKEYESLLKYYKLGGG